MDILLIDLKKYNVRFVVLSIGLAANEGVKPPVPISNRTDAVMIRFRGHRMSFPQY